MSVLVISRLLISVEKNKTLLAGIYSVFTLAEGVTYVAKQEGKVVFELPGALGLHSKV